MCVMINDATKSTECDDISAYRSDKILIFKTHRPNIYNTGFGYVSQKIAIVHPYIKKETATINYLQLLRFFQKNRIAQKKFERRLIS